MPHPWPDPPHRTAPHPVHSIAHTTTKQTPHKAAHGAGLPLPHPLPPFDLHKRGAALKKGQNGPQKPRAALAPGREHGTHKTQKRETGGGRRPAHWRRYRSMGPGRLLNNCQGPRVPRQRPSAKRHRTAAPSGAHWGGGARKKSEPGHRGTVRASQGRRQGPLTCCDSAAVRSGWPPGSAPGSCCCCGPSCPRSR